MQAQAIMSDAAPPSKERNRLYPSAGIALAVEVVMLAGLGFWLTRPHPLPPPPVTIALAPVQEAKPAPPVPKPVPKQIPKPVHHVVQQHEQPKPVQHEQPKPITPIPTPTPVPVPQPVPKPPPPAPEPPAPSRPDASFESRMRAAIQAAVHYPESARMSNLEGKARVAFTYVNGTVSEVHLVASSGSSNLDAAAVAAVRNASMPPPQGFVGRTLHETVWVFFNLDDAQ